MEKLADGLWTQARPLRFLGVETGTRMTLVQLGNGGLFVHSPGPLDDATRKFVRDSAGGSDRVTEPVPSPVGRPMEGVLARRVTMRLSRAGEEARDLPWDRVLGDEAEPLWQAELDQVFFGARAMENEVVFFHRASRSLICCDIVFNLSKHPSWFTRLVATCSPTGARAPPGSSTS